MWKRHLIAMVSYQGFVPSYLLRHQIEINIIKYIKSILIHFEQENNLKFKHRHKNIKAQT